MSAQNTPVTSQTDWERLRTMTDDEIDYSDIPPLEDSFFERAGLFIPARDAYTLARLDPDLAEWYRAQDADYPKLINRILRDYIKSQSSTGSLNGVEEAGQTG